MIFKNTILFSMLLCLASCSVLNHKNTASGIRYYVIKEPLGGIMGQHPATSIEKAGLELTREQHTTLWSVDGNMLTGDTYFLVAVPNKGKTRFTWVGKADGNGQVYLSWYDFEKGEFSFIDLRDVSSIQTHNVDTHADKKNKTLYFMVHCTSGNIFTDQLRIELIPE